MITLESRDKVAVLRLENGVTNAINPEFVRHITQALAEVRDHYQGLVLTGGAKFSRSVLTCRCPCSLI